MTAADSQQNGDAGPARALHNGEQRLPAGDDAAGPREPQRWDDGEISTLKTQLRLLEKDKAELKALNASGADELKTARKENKALLKENVALKKQVGLALEDIKRRKENLSKKMDTRILELESRLDADKARLDQMDQPKDAFAGKSKEYQREIASLKANSFAMAVKIEDLQEKLVLAKKSADADAQARLIKTHAQASSAADLLQRNAARCTAQLLRCSRRSSVLRSPRP
jgi:chromosome segregation ATPase